MACGSSRRACGSRIGEEVAEFGLPMGSHAGPSSAAAAGLAGLGMGREGQLSLTPDSKCRALVELPADKVQIPEPGPLCLSEWPMREQRRMRMR